MSKHKKANKKLHTRGIGDITLNDFANAEVCKNRLRKSTSNVTTVIKRIETELKPWDERDDFDDEFDTLADTNGDATASTNKKNVDRKCKNEMNAQTSRIGNDYPLDVWFLISEYIRPEDIGRFAGICKTSFAVVCTAKFWFSLYKRYYKSVPALPDHLQPERLVRLYGLRTSVIRALHFMYTPYISKFGTITLSETHPSTLIERQCVLMSFHKQKKDWLYYFKFKENLPVSLPHYSRRSQSQEERKPDLIEMLEDVSANPEENCKILQVTCLNFIGVPLVQGLTLKSATLTLSQGFRHRRLQLGFGSGIHAYYSYNSIGGSNGTMVILDPVVSVKVLDWWHPHYPYNHNIENLLNQE